MNKTLRQELEEIAIRVSNHNQYLNTKPHLIHHDIAFLINRGLLLVIESVSLLLNENGDGNDKTLNKLRRKLMSKIYDGLKKIDDLKEQLEIIDGGMNEYTAFRNN
jgi:hypothetical protein